MVALYFRSFLLTATGLDKLDCSYFLNGLAFGAHICWQISRECTRGQTSHYISMCILWSLWENYANASPSNTCWGLPKRL